jgi:transcriptional regulator with GAF, ATPase, and Fis domain
MRPKEFPEDPNPAAVVAGGEDSQEKELALLNRIQGAMRHIPDFGEACKAILDVVVDQMDAENCSIMLQDPLSGELTIRAARGKTDGKSIYYPEPPLQGGRFKPGEGIAGSVLKDGRAILVDDVTNEPRFVQVQGLKDQKVRSLVCFPIREKDQVVGVFNISHSRKSAFGEGDELALSYVSTQLGAALTSTRFFLKRPEVNRLLHSSSEARSPGSLPRSAPGSATFIEVGEVMGKGHEIFLYASGGMQRIREVIDQVANTDVTIFIQGESGVGKEVVARSIHLNSNRRDQPFVKVNCAALPPELLESELFGYEKGAFTGAYRQKPGKFELANGGTIFLDEIGEVDASLQGKLLQVLQDHEFSRLGGKRDVQVNVRVLAATNRNIEEAVRAGRFREDLYYRLNVVNITIPPLRDRKEEIPMFVEYFLNKFSLKHHKRVKAVPPETLQAFLGHEWPGNVRELENLLQRYVILGSGDEKIRDLMEKRKGREEGLPAKGGRPSLKEVLGREIRKAEADVMRRALEETNWNRKKAARLLNISYKSLLNKIQDYGL